MSVLQKVRSITVRPPGRITRPTTVQRCILAVSLLLASVAAWSFAPTSAANVPYRIDLRVLLLDDNSPWVDAMETEMHVEGVPFTAIDLSSASRPLITDGLLSSGDRAFFQGVVGADYLSSMS